jgi:hypothetical protein
MNGTTNAEEFITDGKSSKILRSPCPVVPSARGLPYHCTWDITSRWHSPMRWCARPGPDRGAGANVSARATGTKGAAARLSFGRCAAPRGAQAGKRAGSRAGVPTFWGIARYSARLVRNRRSRCGCGEGTGGVLLKFPYESCTTFQ